MFDNFALDLRLPSDLGVRRLSAADEIVAALRQLILEGALTPGTPLREVPLAEAFDVSRTTIRDAVRALVHEGLARQERHRSAVVVEITADDAVDIYGVRRLLELSAADHVAAITAEEVESVNRAFEHLRKLAPTGDWSATVSADLEFHESIIALHRSPRLLRCFGSIKSELAFCLSVIRLHEREDERPDRIVREHDEIRQAVVGGSVTETRALLAAHFSYYQERVTEALRERTAGDRKAPNDRPGGSQDARPVQVEGSRSA